MKTQFKDIAHLYQGVMMQTQMGIFPLITRYDDAWMLDTIAYGANAVEQDIKPILRPLSDVTDKEFNVVCELLGWNKNEFDKEWFYSTIKSTMIYLDQAFKIVPFLMSKQFDLFGLIESGQAIDATTISPTVTK